VATFLEAVGQAARSAYCFALGNFDTGARALGRVALGAAAVSRVSGALRAQLCNDSPDPIPGDPPFEGGQCEAVYTAVFQTVSGSGALSNPFTRRIRGPIGGTRIFQDGASFQAQVFCRGININASNCGALTQGEPAFRGVGVGGSSLEGGQLNILSATICSGTDNCGDPDPIAPPPGVIFAPEVDVTYVDEGDNNITVPVNFVFAPVFVDLDGSLTVPLNFDAGGVNFTGNLTVAPEFNLNIRPEGITRPPGQPDNPDAPGEPGDPGDEPEEREPDDPLIIGVLVFSDVDEDAKPSSILFDKGPNLYVPRLADVQFAIAVGDDVGWTSDLPVKSTQAYIPCPAPQGAIDVRVSAQPGVEARFTPVRGQPLTDFT